MSRYILAEQALADLGAIWRRVADFAGEGSAERIGDELIAAFELLGDHPGIGHPRDDVPDPGVRFWSVRTYLVAYNPHLKPTRILRIVGGRQDVGPIFAQT